MAGDSHYSLVHVAEADLRGESQARPEPSRNAWAGPAAAYGLVVGSFSGGAQYWAAPLKVSAGLMLSGVICLPSLYVFACLSGARARLGEVAGLVAGLLGLVTVLLLGFAPVAWLFSQSTTSAVTMGMLHLAFWITALMFGFRFLRAAFRQFEGHSMGVLRVWMFLFLLVTLQMTTSLRPLLESDSRMLPARKQFFLGHWAECLRAPAAEPETP